MKLTYPNQKRCDVCNGIYYNIVCLNNNPGYVNVNDGYKFDLSFYHSDHLGSASFITDVNGNATQHLQYLPFGESWIDQRNSSYSSRYTFSAKEIDDETGYSYFEARYYDSDLSVWLSVDPLADERILESPYSYCGNNPIMRIDPTGLIWKDGDGNEISKDNQKNIKVYIFYDPKSFSEQSKIMYNNTVFKYGKDAVAMSDVTTEK